MKKDTAMYGFYKKGYLVLKRKTGQGFNIDKDTEVVVAKVDEHHVYLAIKAPGKKVLRNEILTNEPRDKEKCESMN